MPDAARHFARRAIVRPTWQHRHDHIICASMQFKLWRRRGIGNRTDREARGYRESKASPLMCMRSGRTVNRHRCGD